MNALERESLELGGAAWSLRQRGYSWQRIASALELFDASYARILAGKFVLRFGNMAEGTKVTPNTPENTSSKGGSRGL